MSYDYDHIDQLIAEDIAGVISLEDLQILKKVISEHEEVHKLWLKRHNRFKSKETRLWLRTGIVPRKKKRLFTKRLLYLSGSVIVVIILFTALYLTRPFDKAIPAKESGRKDSTSKKHKNPHPLQRMRPN